MRLRPSDATSLIAPEDTQELQEAVRSANAVRALGSGPCGATRDESDVRRATRESIACMLGALPCCAIRRCPAVREATLSCAAVRRAGRSTRTCRGLARLGHSFNALCRLDSLDGGAGSDGAKLVSMSCMSMVLLILTQG